MWDIGVEEILVVTGNKGDCYAQKKSINYAEKFYSEAARKLHKIHSSLLILFNVNALLLSQR